MNILVLGGTGTISTAVVAGCLQRGWQVTLLNRGSRPAPAGAESLVADLRDETAVAAATAGKRYDAVAQFAGYNAADAARDIRLFGGRCGQYLYISSASAYQKPILSYPITESTPLANPYWQYSRDKAAAEAVLLAAWREQGFPVTIVRPSHTYDARKVPLALNGTNGSWQVLARMLAEKPVIIPGDGTSLWALTAAEDFAAGYLGLVGNPRTLGSAYHITTDEVMPWDQIYRTVADALGRPLHACHIASDLLADCGKAYDFRGQLLGDKANTVLFDNTKIKRAVPGFACTVPMAQGLRRTVENVLAHPCYQTPDPQFDAWCDRMIEARCAARRAGEEL